MLTDKHRLGSARAADFVAAVLMVAVRFAVTLVMWVCLGAAWLLATLGFAARRAGGLLARLYRYLLWIFLWVLHALYSVLAAAAEAVRTRVSRLSSVVPLGLGEETEQANEKYHTDKISGLVLNRLTSDYERGNTRRDAHRKHHGLLKAVFEIDADIDKDYAVGLFAAHRRYDAWVRFSNSSGSENPDSSADVRGVAIKLHDGESVLLDESCEPKGEDLLLVSEPVFPTHSVGQFSYVTHALLNPFSRHALWFLYALVAPWRWYVIRNLLAVMRRRHKSLLNIDYHSVTPYRFGDEAGRSRAVKYLLKPRMERTVQQRDDSRDFLRHDLRRNIGDQDFVFDFYLHEQLHPYKMPIERPGIRWPETISTPVKVATLTLLKQRFDTLELGNHAENITFTPWNCREEHRPIGGINRARETIYKRVSSFRHERNELRRNEPTLRQIEQTWRCAQPGRL